MTKFDVLKTSILQVQKILPQVNFLQSPTHTDIIEFYNFLPQLKNLMSGREHKMCGISFLLILKVIMTFQS